jgi:hypothetical protein
LALEQAGKLKSEETKPADGSGRRPSRPLIERDVLEIERRLALYRAAEDRG